MSESLLKLLLCFYLSLIYVFMYFECLFGYWFFIEKTITIFDTILSYVFIFDFVQFFSVFTWSQTVNSWIVGLSSLYLNIGLDFVVICSLSHSCRLRIELPTYTLSQVSNMIFTTRTSPEKSMWTACEQQRKAYIQFAGSQLQCSLRPIKHQRKQKWWVCS